MISVRNGERRKERKEQVNWICELILGLSPFDVDSIERWLSSFSGVPCSRDSDRAAQVCNYMITNL